MKKGKLNNMDAFTLSYFFVACESNSLEGVKDAIERGVGINIIKDKTSALILACQHHHTEIIHCLIEHQADISLLDYQAIGKSNQESLRALIMSGAITSHMVDMFKESDNSRYRQFFSKIQKCVDYLLREFCEKGNLDYAKKMIELGANVHNFDLVKVAMQGRYIDILTLLLQYGININLSVKNTTSFLIEACIQEGSELVQFALNHGANVSDGAILTTMLVGETDSFKLLINRLPEVLSLKDKILEAFDYYQTTTNHDYTEMRHFFNQCVLKEELDENLVIHPEINKMKL